MGKSLRLGFVGRFILGPEKNNQRQRNERQPPDHGQADLEAAGGVAQSAEYFLHGAAGEPRGGADEAGDFAHVLAGEVLFHGIGDGEYAERGGGDDEQHGEQWPAFGQVGGDGGDFSV